MSSKRPDLKHTLRGIVGAAIFASAALGAATTASAFSYDDVTSDLPSAGATPTSLGILAPGTNTVSGSLDFSAGDDIDFMTFTIPSGLPLTTLAFKVLEGAGIGWDIYGEGSPGSLLATPFFSSFSFGPGPVSLFSPTGLSSLASGFYGILLADIFKAGAFSYELVFNESAAVVPLPAALPLLFSGLLGLGAFGWRKRKAV